MAAAVTIDTVAPVIGTISEASSNATTTLAKAGDVITASFTSTDTVSGVTIGGHTATVVHGSGNNYTATYTVVAGDNATSTAVVVNSVDAAGNPSSANLPAAVTIDTVAPVAPAVTSTTTPERALTVEGVNGAVQLTAEAGSSVLVTFTDSFGHIIRKTVTGNGTTPVAVALAAADIGNTGTTLHDGTITVSAVATDAAGNHSLSATSKTFTLDTIAPVITSTSAAYTDTGRSATDHITSATTSAITVNAELGSTVVVLDNGTQIGTATELTSGVFKLTVNNLSNNVHVFTATATDLAGNTSSPSAIATETVDTLAPDAPIFVDTSVSNGMETGNTLLTGQIISGSAEAGSIVAVTETFNGTTVSFGSVVAKSDNTFSLIAALPIRGVSGTHTLSVTATDAAGNVSLVSSSDFILNTVALNADTQPTNRQGAAAGTVVDQMNAFDSGFRVPQNASNTAVTYSLINAPTGLNNQPLFAINSQTGAISLTKVGAEALASYAQPYTLSVQASDSSTGGSDTQSFTINVQNAVNGSSAQVPGNISDWSISPAQVGAGNGFLLVSNADSNLIVQLPSTVTSLTFDNGTVGLSSSGDADHAVGNITISAADTQNNPTITIATGTLENSVVFLPSTGSATVVGTAFTQFSPFDGTSVAIRSDQVDIVGNQANAVFTAGLNNTVTLKIYSNSAHTGAPLSTTILSRVEAVNFLDGSGQVIGTTAIVGAGAYATETDAQNDFPTASIFSAPSATVVGSQANATFTLDSNNTLVLSLYANSAHSGAALSTMYLSGVEEVKFVNSSSNLTPTSTVAIVGTGAFADDAAVLAHYQQNTSNLSVFDTSAYDPNTVNSGLTPYTLYTPLVLDLKGTGITTSSLAQSGVTFDLNNSGASDHVGWITPGEGFLVNLPTGATTITNGSELFGSSTVLPNGQTAINGFAALAAYDFNGSGSIDASDPIFSQLRVWVETGVGGPNGTTPQGSLYTLADLGIVSLNLNATTANQNSNGNVIGLVSSYTTTDGQTHELADVWLADAIGSATGTGTVTDQHSWGNVSDPAQDPVQLVAHTQTPEAPQILSEQLVLKNASHDSSVHDSGVHDITNIVSGHAQANSVVNLYETIDGVQTLVGTTAADTTGAFTYTVSSGYLKSASAVSAVSDASLALTGSEVSNTPTKSLEEYLNATTIVHSESVHSFWENIDSLTVTATDATGNTSAHSSTFNGYMGGSGFDEDNNFDLSSVGDTAQSGESFQDAHRTLDYSVPSSFETLQISTAFADASFVSGPSSSSQTPEIQMLLADGTSQILSGIKEIQFNDQNVLIVGPGGYSSVQEAQAHALGADSLLINLPGQLADWSIVPVQDMVNGTLVTQAYSLSDPKAGIDSMLVPSNVSNIVFADGGDLTLSDCEIEALGHVSYLNALEEASSAHPDLHMLSVGAYKPEDTVIDLKPDGGFAVHQHRHQDGAHDSLGATNFNRSASAVGAVGTYDGDLNAANIGLLGRNGLSPNWHSNPTSGNLSLNLDQNSLNGSHLEDVSQQQTGHLMRQESAVYGALYSTLVIKEHSLVRMNDVNALFAYANRPANGYISETDIVVNNDHTHSADFNFAPMHDVYHHF